MPSLQMYIQILNGPQGNSLTKTRDRDDTFVWSIWSDVNDEERPYPLTFPAHFGLQQWNGEEKNIPAISVHTNGV